MLFDRDGTLVADVPYNGDPTLVRPMPGAKAALRLLRARGLAVGVVSNQSGVARGLLTGEGVVAVRRRVEDLLGPFDVWAVCPHAPEDGCGCRKPAPGLVHAACVRLGLDPRRTVVVGDIGADLAAARAAGARGVLVPTPQTRPAEVAAAAETASDLLAAARLLTAAHVSPTGAVAPPEPPAGAAGGDRPGAPGAAPCDDRVSAATEGHHGPPGDTAPGGLDTDVPAGAPAGPPGRAGSAGSGGRT